jgi:hypothetical protein
VNALQLGAVALGDKIETFGAYFGYAAVIGLGVLSLLYFAQAKEVKRLREWAGRAPERDAELVQRAQSEVSRRVVAQPAVPQPGLAVPVGPQTPAAQQAEAARKAAAAAVMQKFQPGGATAPGGTPVVAPPGQLARPGGLGVQPTAASPTAPATAAGPGGGTATPGVPAAPGAASAPGAPTTAGPSPGPAVPPSAATAGAVAAARQAAIAGRSPASSSNGDAHDPLNPPISPLPDPPSRQPREVTLTSDRDAGRSGSRVGLIVGGAFTVLVIAVAIVLLLSAGGDTPPKDNTLGNASSPPSATKPPPPAAAATQVNRRATQVAVLNGTVQNGLAASVASKIEEKGFTILSKGNANQQVTTTTVSYARGHKPAALLVAKIVGVSAGAVAASDANASVAAGPDANVVVIIGADVASTG